MERELSEIVGETSSQALLLPTYEPGPASGFLLVKGSCSRHVEFEKVKVVSLPAQQRCQANPTLEHP